MLKVVVFLSFLALNLMAGFIPSKTYATVTGVNGDTITLSNPFAINGMSGYLLRRLNSGKEYALLVVKQVSPNRAVVIDKDPLNGKGLANIRPIPKVGDRVVGGFLYDKVMVLAPNRDTFINIQNRFGIRSINPDIFMSFLLSKGSSYPSSSDYKEFAKLSGVGLFVIFKNGFVTLYDPLSEVELKKVMMDISNYQAMQPFYNTFK